MAQCTSARCCTLSWPVRTILRLSKKPTKHGRFSWASQYRANSARCAAGYYPAVEALDSLYSKYPNRTINTVEGWPVYYSYWSGSNSTSLSSGAKLDFYYVVDLADGSRRSENSSPSSVWQYQICAGTPIPQATQITLTSRRRWMTLFRR